MAAISIADFEAALDAHGPDPGRWPEPLREDAEALLASSTEAQRLLTAAKAVEASLRTENRKAPEGLADRIIDRALGRRDPG